MLEATSEEYARTITYHMHKMYPIKMLLVYRIEDCFTLLYQYTEKHPDNPYSWVLQTSPDISLENIQPDYVSFLDSTDYEVGRLTYDEIDNMEEILEKDI
jgi:predicted S18 family serine protease